MTSLTSDAFKALANPERRRLLIALAEHNPQSDQTFDYPDDVPPESRENEEKILLRTYHTHLPMLEAGGFIEWQKDDQEITKGPNFDVVRPLIQVLDQENRFELVNDL